MTIIVDATALRLYIETDLADNELTQILAGSEAVIVGVTGVVASHTDFLEGGQSNIYTSRAVSSITTIKERNYPDDAQTTLSFDDYRLEQGFKIRRLREGTNARIFWAPFVEVVFVPDIDTAMLEGVQVNLCKFAIIYSGTLRQIIGDFEFWAPDTAQETRALLLPLTSSRLRMAIR